ncbi:MAG TPA: copper transporter [Candidatus Corynebacterium avicola]|uniref:Copper transporter n=1 Tax=Candidatus Corynebacterium avicola TaxID=2838527 RepID=A0A9D1RPE8_9CORY|nr:copper transporter [Candidatus Corynebacterium avicola]
MGAGKATGLAAAGIAAGTLLGFYVLAPNVEGGPTGVDSETQKELDAETVRADRAEAAVAGSDAVLDGASGGIVNNALEGKHVLVLATADADEESVTGVGELIDAAGGENSGAVQLSEDATASGSGDQLKSIAASSLPAGASLSEDRLDPGYHTGELLGQAVTGASESDRAVAVGALDNTGFFAEGGADAFSGVDGDVDGVVLVTGDASEGDGDGNYSTRFIADLAAGLDATTGGVVLAGGQGSAEQNGAIGLLRDDRAATEEISTVDHVTDVAGRVTTVKALAEQLDGKAGSYGVAPTAAAPTVGEG